MQESHIQGTFSWPRGNRIAVMLSFDFQGGEGIQPLKDGRIDHEAYTQAEYGPQTGIWRILRLLEEQNVTATFLTCGGIAERYPDAVKAIAAKGHEIAGHGYHHETARDLTKDQEKKIIERTTAVIQALTGKRPLGWRSCTQSANSLELLIAQGYLWNSNSFSFDLPFVWVKGKRRILELPRQPFGDGRLYGRRDSGTPQAALNVWKSLFDELYQESKTAPAYCPFQLHPYISSRPGRAMALAELIQYMKKHPKVWFATGSDISQWCLEQIFA